MPTRCAPGLSTALLPFPISKNAIGEKLPRVTSDHRSVLENGILSTREEKGLSLALWGLPRDLWTELSSVSPDRNLNPKEKNEAAQVSESFLIRSNFSGH